MNKIRANEIVEPKKRKHYLKIIIILIIIIIIISITKRETPNIEPKSSLIIYVTVSSFKCGGKKDKKRNSDENWSNSRV